MLRIGQVESTAQNNLYTDGNVAGGIAATRLRAVAFNAIQEELAYIVESAGATLSLTDTTQVLTALKNLLSGRLIKSQLITSSVSFTPQAATKFLRIRAIAGGGGSGGTPATSSTTSSCGQAGFYGQYIEVIIPVSAITAPVAVTIGAGGAGGTSGGNQGGTGGVTSFGSIFSLGGGPGGLWLAASAGVNVIGPSRRTATITSTITPLASSNGVTHAPRILQAALSIASDNAADQSPFPGGYYGMGADGNIIGTSSAASAGVVGIGGAMLIEEYA